MKAVVWELITVTQVLIVLLSPVRGQSRTGPCRGLSEEVVCQCNDDGHCEKDTVQVDPWLSYALKTQMETQLDIPFDHVQLLGAHNAYNNRAYGVLYGGSDNCTWPPPYATPCIGLGNQEFSILDLLNMGVRAVELDNWYCQDAMRIAHLGLDKKLTCSPRHVLFSDAIADIGSWMNRTENEDEIIRIYMNEKYDQCHDDAVNGPFERYLGHDRILSPADLRDTYNGAWPTLRQMREAGKRVVIVHGSSGGTAGGSYLHQGIYIHAHFWEDTPAKEFTNYPHCGGKNSTNHLRFSADSTHYGPGPLDGPSRVGVILDLSELVKCRVQYPAPDQITPQLLRSAVYSWARDQPSTDVDEQTCVMLDFRDSRWYTPSDCDEDHHYACQNTEEPSDWMTSIPFGPYNVISEPCIPPYRFSVPQNGYQHQKLVESLHTRSVWLNVKSLHHGYRPTTVEPTEGVTSGGNTRRQHLVSILIIASLFVSCVQIRL